MTTPTALPLHSLHHGAPGITPTWGAALAEAASVSLESQGHSTPRQCDVAGTVTHSHLLTWTPCDDQARRAWGDLEEAAEHGAYGIAALLVAEHTPYEVVERSRKGTGFDYWLGEKGQGGALFQRAARMEVSGIQKGSTSTIGARVRKKLDQTIPTDGVLPAIVVVVEFGSPRVKVATK